MDELANNPDTKQQLALFDAEERERFQSDIAVLRRRLGEIDDDIKREVDNLMARYKVRGIHWFPVAVEIVVPLGEM